MPGRHLRRGHYRNVRHILSRPCSSQFEKILLGCTPTRSGHLRVRILGRGGGHGAVHSGLGTPRLNGFILEHTVVPRFLQGLKHSRSGHCSQRRQDEKPTRCRCLCDAQSSPRRSEVQNRLRRRGSRRVCATPLPGPPRGDRTASIRAAIPIKTLYRFVPFWLFNTAIQCEITRCNAIRCGHLRIAKRVVKC
jgi:hypothetical protein